MNIEINKKEEIGQKYTVGTLTMLKHNKSKSDLVAFVICLRVLGHLCDKNEENKQPLGLV